MKCKWVFIFVLSSFLWGGRIVCWAQGNLVSNEVSSLQRMSRSIPWQKALRMGGQSYIVSDIQIGKEVLQGTFHSAIGTEKHIRFNQVRSFFRPLGPTLSRSIARQIVKPQQGLTTDFVGYYSNFPKFWRKFTQRTHSHGGRLEVILEAAYGDAPKFAGRFVETFDEVMALANSPVLRTFSIGEALQQAFVQAEEIKHGFFVVLIAGNKRRPKAVLLLDLVHSCYISYNNSVANAWAQVIAERANPDEIGKDNYSNVWEKNLTTMDRRSTQGIMLRVDGEKVPKQIAVSSTGKSWKVYHLNAKDALTLDEAEQGLNLWNAWNKGYYILQGKNTPWLFASEKGKPLFATVREVDEYVLRQHQFNQ